MRELPYNCDAGVATRSPDVQPTLQRVRAVSHPKTAAPAADTHRRRQRGTKCCGLGGGIRWARMHKLRNETVCRVLAPGFIADEALCMRVGRLRGGGANQGSNCATHVECTKELTGSLGPWRCEMTKSDRGRSKGRVEGPLSDVIFFHVPARS